MNNQEESEKIAHIKEKVRDGFLLAIPLFIFVPIWKDLGAFALIVAFGAIATWEFAKNIGPNISNSLDWKFCLVFGGMFIFVPLSLLALVIKNVGWEWAFFIAANCYGGDIGAFLFGSLFVKKLPWKRHMISTASPNKSWEALVFGGIPFAYIMCILIFYPIMPRTFIQDFSTISVLVITGVFLGAAGDMLESWLKRKAGVKDSGKIFRSHGGALDRIDSLLTTSILYVYVYFFVIK